MNEISERRDSTSALSVMLFLLLAVPGSPTLAFDGLPFGNRVEVAALVLFVVTLRLQAVRKWKSQLLSSRSRRSFSNLILISLILLKLFTFLRFPIGDNFEVCIKSTYAPIGERCEKSFDYLFHSNDGVNGIGDITRIDKRIDFETTTGDERSLLGASHSTWNLPFQNEFPRFSQLWLDRLPFSAKVGATVQLRNDSLLPIEYTGDVVISTQKVLTTSASYEFRSALLVPIPAGRTEVTVDYSYSDDNVSEVPEQAPPPRGPYAHLVLGNPFDPRKPADLMLTIRGHAVNLTDERTVTRVEGRSRDGTIVAETEVRPDLASYFGGAKHASGGFTMRYSLARSLRDFSPVTIVALLSDGHEQILGRIEPPDLSSDVVSPRAVPIRDSVLTSDFGVRITLGEKIGYLRAEHRFEPSILGRATLALLDVLIFGIFLVLSLVLIIASILRRLKVIAWSLLVASLTIAAWIAVRQIPGSSLFSVVPESLVLALFLVSGLAWVHLTGKSRLAYALPVSLIASSIPILDASRRFTGLASSDWWGFMLFRDRPMDWFVYQGYAYQILVQQSFRAGENVFYFMPGARYIIFLTHILFGNNDVLIAIATYSAMILAAIMLIFRLLGVANTDNSQRLMTLAFAAVVLMVVFDSLTVQLALSSASEIFAWILLIGCSTQLGNRMSYQRWHLLGFLLGSIVFLRPNYLAVCVCFAMALVLSPRERRRDVSGVLSKAWMLLGFIVATFASLAHNVYFGDSFNVFTARTDPAQTIFEPTRLLRFFSDAFVREIVWQKFVGFLYWQSPSMNVFLVASWLSQILFVWAVVSLMRNRRQWKYRLALLASPMMYVLSAAPFGVMTIPERQFTTATLAAAISAVLSTAAGRASESRTDTAVSDGSNK